LREKGAPRREYGDATRAPGEESGFLKKAGCQGTISGYYEDTSFNIEFRSGRPRKRPTSTKNNQVQNSTLKLVF
jgi:hypothetical protein